MAVAYGHDVQGENDHFATLAEGVSEMMGVAASPGAMAVNVFPICKPFLNDSQ